MSKRTDEAKRKLLIHNAKAMQQEGLSPSQIAKKLGKPYSLIARLLNL